jgi:hypothetical protein
MRFTSSILDKLRVDSKRSQRKAFRYRKADGKSTATSSRRRLW